MRGIGIVISLFVAAAVGAAIMYFVGPHPPLVWPFAGPGNGVVTCPGNASCPTENRSLDGTRAFHGLMVPATAKDSTIMLCTGDADASPGCPRDFIGALVRYDAANAGPTPLKVCKPGAAAPCSGADVWVLYCENRRKPKAPADICSALPELTNPRYKP